MPVPNDVPNTCPTLPQLPHLLERLERTWAQVAVGLPPPNLKDYLPAQEDPLRVLLLRELVRVDLEIRWRRGLPTKLEFYVEQFPELNTAANLTAEFIFHEYRVRLQYGDRPQLRSYRERYPAQFRRLQELARATQPMPAVSSPPPAKNGTAQSKGPATPAAGSSTPSEVDTSGIVWPTLPPIEDSSKKSGDIVLPPPTSENVPDQAAPNFLSMVGGYRLSKRLGSGALGEVWKAEAPGGIEVAVKRLSRTLATHEAQYELKSLEHVKLLRHPYLAQIHAFWVHKGRLYIVMELADGSLLDRVAHYREQGQPGIPADELLRYMGEAAEALDFLHGKGVHHRDIKPANILLLNGHTKVADFGLARPLGLEQSVINATFCGTPGFMAPEVWDSKFSNHSDQWSLAVTYLELRLNRRLFQNRSMQALMSEICAGRFDLAPLKRAEQRVVRRALAQDPRHRYPTCAAFVQALQAVFHPPPKAPAPSRRRWLSTAIVFACLVASALLASFFGLLGGTSSVVPPKITLEKPAPLRVNTGGEVQVVLNYVREHYAGAIDFVGEVENVSDLVTVRTTAADNSDAMQIMVHADARTPPGHYRIHLHTAEGQPAAETILSLTVLYLPANFQPLGNETQRDVHGVEYYKAIERRLSAKETVEFVLIPEEKKRAELRRDEVKDTFYISRYKITRGQFGVFVTQHPEKLNANKGEGPGDDKPRLPELDDRGKKIPSFQERWQRHADDDRRLPVRNVKVTEAHEFAQFLRGWLPTLRQWNKAAGFYPPLRGQGQYPEGPYKGRWKDKPPHWVAVNLPQPLPVGEAEGDESPYHCRDMAGNGLEWTRDVRGGAERQVPLTGPLWGGLDEVVYLRGRSFDEDSPLTFNQMDRNDDFIWPYGKTRSEIGFRVVLEPGG